MKLMILVALALIATAPAPAPPAPLPSVGPWQVEYADAMCALSHQFGTGPSAVTLVFRPWPMGDKTEIAMIQPGANGFESRIGKGRVRLDPAGTELAADVTLYYLRKRDLRVTTLTVDQARLVGLEDAKTIVLTLGGKPPVAVLPSNLKAAMVALGKCQDDLLTGWGIDLITRQAVVTKSEARGNPADWITSDDYPPSALSNGDSGTTSILWQITPQGTVTQCRIIASSGHPVLDAAACEAITRRGRYTPAVDKDGKPRASYATRRITWTAP